MFDGRFREAVDRGTKPVGLALQRAGVTANVLTALGLLAAAVTAVAIAVGWWWQAILLLIVTGATDLLDGAVAKASGSASRRGAYFDSVTDRVADALLFGGCAWYLSSNGGGHVVVLPLAILAAAFLVSYQRAKAESLGIPAKGGLMERAERLILLGVALLTSAIFVPVLWVLFVLTTGTAIGRFQRTWVAAGRPAGAPTPTRRGFVQRADLTGSKVQERTVAAVARWRTVRVEVRSRARDRREARAHRRANRTHRTGA
jgi:CDP-diacylglycerol---glycerol-3-phosphate 3-phosphatidyltransferase